MAYVDISTLQTIAVDEIVEAATLQQIRDNQEFLIDPPKCSVYNSSAVSLTDDTATELDADSEFYDSDSMHSTSSNTSRITIQTAGTYLLTAVVSFAADATGNRQAAFDSNGSSQKGGALLDNAGASNSTTLTIARTLVLSASDYIEVQATQRSGGNLNATLTEFSAIFISR